MAQHIESIDNFRAALKNSQTPVVVIDFYGDFCGPCKAIAPRIDRLAAKYPSVGFYKINVEHEATSSLCEMCEISALPTFCFFVKTEYVTSMVGADVVKLERIVNEQLDKLNTEAAAAVQVSEQGATDTFIAEELDNLSLSGSAPVADAVMDL